MSSGFAEWFDQCLPLPLDQVRGAVVVSTYVAPFICGMELGLMKCLVNEHTCTARRGILVGRCRWGVLHRVSGCVEKRQVRFHRVRGVQVCEELNE